MVAIDAKRRYNDKGQVVYEKWYGIDGAPINPSGNTYVAQEIVYNDNGKVSEYRYLDENDRPVKCSAGYEIQGRIYDEKDNVAEYAYRDASGVSIPCTSGKMALAPVASSTLSYFSSKLVPSASFLTVTVLRSGWIAVTS